MRPVSTSLVSRAALAARRGLVVLVIAFGLVVMHGGVGQAQASVGAMSGMPTPTSPTLMSEHSHDDTAVDVEDPSGNPTKSPASAHPATCAPARRLSLVALAPILRLPSPRQPSSRCPAST